MYNSVIGDFEPSYTSFDGEILVKSKTLGRWESKRFIMDPENAVLIIKRESMKKKPKIYDLKFLKVILQIKKHDRFQLELASFSSINDNLVLGTTDFSVFTQVLNAIKSCKINIISPSVKRQDADTTMKRQESQFQWPEKESSRQVSQEEVVMQKAVVEEVKVKKVAKVNKQLILPQEFSSFDILNILENRQNKENLELVFDESNLKIWRQWSPNSQSIMLKYFFKSIPYIVELILDEPQVSIKTIGNLINDTEQIQLWNEFVTRRIENDEIVEQRNYKGYLPFLREFVYIQHILYDDDQMVIIDKGTDKSDTQIVQGNIYYRVIRIVKGDRIIRIDMNLNESNGGFLYPNEDAFFTLKYLEQFVNLKNYISQTYPPTEQIVEQFISEESIPKEVLKSASNENIVLDANMLSQGNEDEFFDCTEYDLIEENRIELNKEIETIVHDEQIENSLKVDKAILNPFQLVEWVSHKLQLIESGELNIFHLKNRYLLNAQPKDNPQYRVLPEGQNFLYSDEFTRDIVLGQLKMINQEQIVAQKQVLKYLLKKIGSNLLSGKSVASISLPVNIFETRSNTERVCNAMTFAPFFLERATSDSPIQRVKAVMGFAQSFLVNYLCAGKPFNPILGETYQGWIDKCPIYAEQISHHPPTVSVQLYGRKYRVEASLEMIVIINPNSVTGKNKGSFKVTFDDGQQVHIILAPGYMTGTTYGERCFYFYGKTICIDAENQIIAQVYHNPDKKVCQFLSICHQSLLDFLCGGIFKVYDSAIQQFKRDRYLKYQGLHNNEIKQILHKIEGHFTTQIMVDQIVLLDVQQMVPFQLDHEIHPLASDSNYRQDLLWWKLKDFDMSQKYKEQMEIKQRGDKKLREQKNRRQSIYKLKI